MPHVLGHCFPPQQVPKSPARTVSATAETTSAVTWQDTVKMFAALAIGMTALATARTTERHIGSAGVGALAENPKLFGNILVFLVIPEDGHPGFRHCRSHPVLTHKPRIMAERPV